VDAGLGDPHLRPAGRRPRRRLSHRRAARALVEWVEAHGKHLTTIYLTHGDHFFGLGALLERFPTARAVATPAVVQRVHQQAEPVSIANFWGARFPGQLPDRLVIAEELKGKVIDLEGRRPCPGGSWAHRH